MVGLEPTACRLRGGCSTTELHRHDNTPSLNDARVGYQSGRSTRQIVRLFRVCAYGPASTGPDPLHSHNTSHQAIFINSDWSTTWTSFCTSSTASGGEAPAATRARTRTRRTP